MKRLIMTTVVLAAVVLTASLMVSAQDANLAAQDSSGLPDKTWKRGLAIAPVPLNLEGKSKKTVGEGSYIVNTSCIDCHTSPVYAEGGDPFRGQPEKINAAAYLAGGAHFGPFTSANLTPDEKGLPAGLTLDQFVQVMRTGKDFKNRHPQFGPVLQVMPWPVLGKLTDDDLEAIYEYLRAIPHIASAQ
jgi:cytochrome c553